MGAQREIAGRLFNDVSAETHRIYTWAEGDGILVTRPLWLHVSKSGHYLILSDYSTVYIPTGWRSLQWWTVDGAGPLQF